MCKSNTIIICEITCSTNDKLLITTDTNAVSSHTTSDVHNAEGVLSDFSKRGEMVTVLLNTQGYEVPENVLDIP
jgi:hypothetical protein